jgi:hypothetical protein
MRTQTIGKRINYINSLIKKGSFTFDDMISETVNHKISRVVPWCIKKAGFLNEVSNGRYVINNVGTGDILKDVIKIEQDNNRRFIERKKKKEVKTYKRSEPVNTTIDSFTDQDLISELRNRGYSGEINKSFKI